MDIVRRIDAGTLQKAERLDNGWLKLDAFMARTGVQEYLTPQGTIRREYRPPEEVFKADSLKSFAMVPVTDGHPPVFLDASNTKQFARGAVSENVRQDGNKVRGSLMVHDEELAKRLDKGVRECSFGYVARLDFTPGVSPEGEKYDAIQRDIRGNHLAIVPKGRAGAEVGARMDAAIERVIFTDAEDSSLTQPEQKMATIRLDGVDFEVPAPAEQAMSKLMKADAAAVEVARKDAEAAKATAEKLQAKLDSALDEVKKKDAELAAAPAKIAAAMSVRNDLETKATKILGEEAKFAGKTDAAIRAEVLAKVSPELKLDGKSEAYVEARFDAEVEKFTGHNDSVDEVRRVEPTTERKADAEEIHAKTKDIWKTPLSSTRAVAKS